MALPSGNEPLLAAAPPVPAPVVVVSPQFCAKEVVPLTVTKKAKSLTGGDFAVTDPSGAVVLQFKGSVWSVRNRRVLVDAAGQPILSMHEKVNTPRWAILPAHPFLFFVASFLDMIRFGWIDPSCSDAQSSKDPINPNKKV